MERRLRRIAISPSDFLATLRGQYRVTEGLPSDVEVRGVNGNWERQRIEMLLHSESFEPVPEWEEIPFITSIRVEMLPLGVPGADAASGTSANGPIDDGQRG